MRCPRFVVDTASIGHLEEKADDPGEGEVDEGERQNVRNDARDYVRLVQDNDAWTQFLQEVEAEVEDSTAMALSDFAPAPSYVAGNDLNELLSRIDDTLARESESAEVIPARVYLTEQQTITLYGSITAPTPPRMGDLVSTRGYEGLYDVAAVADTASLRSLDNGFVIQADLEDVAVERRSIDALTPGEKHVLSMDGNVRMIRSLHGITRGHTYTMLLQEVEMIDGFPRTVNTPRMATGEVNEFSAFATMDGMAGRLVIELKSPDGALLTGSLPAPGDFDPSLSMFVVERLPERDMNMREIPLASLRPGDVIVNPIRGAGGDISVPMGSYMTVNETHNKHFELYGSAVLAHAQALADIRVKPTGFMAGREITDKEFYRTGANLADGTVADLRVGDRVSARDMQGVGSEDSFVVVTSIEPSGKTREVRFQDADDYGAPVEKVRLPYDADMPVAGRREGALSEHEVRMVRHRVRVGPAALLSPGMERVAVRGMTSENEKERTVIGTVVGVGGVGDPVTILEEGNDEPTAVTLSDDRAVKYWGQVQDVPDRSGGMASQFMATYARHKNAPPRVTHVEGASAVQDHSNVIALRSA